MNRRLTVSLAVLTAAAVGAAPALAAPKKPITGSYTVTLYPDVTVNQASVPGQPATCGKLPNGTDKHPFAVPGAGTMHVVLDSADPTPSASPLHADWDLYVLDAAGEQINSSHGGTAHEETTDKLKGKQNVTFMVCNVNGNTKATVTYTFTSK